MRVLQDAPDVEGRQYLYRFWDRGTLLYVGISINAYTRAKQHSLNSPFYHRATHVTFEYHETRAEVEEAERRAIRTERPLYNVAGSVPGARIDPKEHLVIQDSEVAPQWEQIESWLAEFQPDGSSILRRMIAVALHMDRVRNEAAEHRHAGVMRDAFKVETKSLATILKRIAKNQSEAKVEYQKTKDRSSIARFFEVEVGKK